MTVALVTGAGGQLGIDVVDVCRDAGMTVVGLDRAALDVGDADAVAAAVADARPNVVFHAAAWTDVDGAESDPDGAARVNEGGSRNVARAAASLGARLVAYSTDFVFAGDRREPYVERDVPAPLSVYGATKLAGEVAAREAHPHGTYVVRTAWVHSPYRRTFVRAILELARDRESLDVVADQVGSPTYTADLARASLDLLRDCAPGLYHLAGSGGCSRAALAAHAIEAAGLACRVEPVGTDRFPRPARRPASAILASIEPGAPVLPPWQDGVARCVARIKETW